MNAMEAIRDECDTGFAMRDAECMLRRTRAGAQLVSPALRARDGAFWGEGGKNLLYRGFQIADLKILHSSPQTVTVKTVVSEPRFEATAGRFDAAT